MKEPSVKQYTIITAVLLLLSLLQGTDVVLLRLVGQIALFMMIAMLVHQLISVLKDWIKNGFNKKS